MYISSFPSYLLISLSFFIVSSKSESGFLPLAGGLRTGLLVLGLTDVLGGAKFPGLRFGPGVGGRSDFFPDFLFFLFVHQTFNWFLKIIASMIKIIKMISKIISHMLNPDSFVGRREQQTSPKLQELE
jgi:hypothetical protein